MKKRKKNIPPLPNLIIRAEFDGMVQEKTLDEVLDLLAERCSVFSLELVTLKSWINGIPIKVTNHPKINYLRGAFANLHASATLIKDDGKRLVKEMRVKKMKIDALLEEREKSSMCFWWPRTKDLPIPQPKTVMIPAPKNLLAEFYNEQADPLINIIANLCREEVKRNNLSFPVFLRTDQTSAKHNWEKSCFIAKPEDFESHIYDLIEMSCMVDVLGLPVNAVFIREFLNLDTKFKAFYGGMPIGAERRYFVRDGLVECHHPYWPFGAIKGETEEPKWRKLLTALNKETPEEITLLTGWAEQIGKVLPGYWSIDFCRKTDGTWALTDMADGACSFHLSECPILSVKK